MAHYPSFGLWVKTLRRIQEWTQYDLAGQVNCSVSMIRKIETNERYPSRALARMLSQRLEVPIDDIPDFLAAADGFLQASTDTVPISTLEPSPICDQHGFRPLTPLLGRCEELTTAASLINHKKVRLLTLLGPGGVGKTRLAYALADQLHSTFAQGAQLVDLTTIASVEELWLTLATIFNLPRGDSCTTEDRVLAGLQQRQFLLVLDNFDALLEAKPLVHQLLTSVPQMRLVLTSRVPVRIDGVHEFQVTPLTVPNTTDNTNLDRLKTNPSITLLVVRTQAIVPTFHLTTTNAPALIAICRQLDGLPLALELAAAQLRVWSPHALSEQLTHDLSVLTQISKDVSSRHCSLQSMIDWSYQSLHHNAQRLLIGMSIFVGGATLEAITAICTRSDNHDTTSLITQSLTTLLEYSLVSSQDTADGNHRFTLLETVRTIAREKLSATGQEEFLHQQHAAYFTCWVEEHNSNTTQDIAISTLFDYEIGNIRMALTWCHTNGQATMLGKLCQALWRYWYVRGLWEEGILWHQRTLALDELLPPALEAALLSGAGGLSLMQNTYNCAAQWLDEAIIRYRALDDSLGLARSLNRLSIIRWHQGHLTEARSLLDESQHYCQQIDAPQDMANILANLGCLSDEQGQFDQARVFHQASLHIRRRLGDTYGITVDLLNLGYSAMIQGDHTTAQTLLEEGLAHSRKHAFHYEEALLVHNLGINAGYQKRLEDARALLNQALAGSRQLGDRLNESRAQSNLGLVAFFDNDISTAIVLFRQSIHDLVALEAWVSIPDSLERLAYAYVAQGQYQRAHWVLTNAEQMRAEEGVKRPPVEETLHTQAREQLAIQGITLNEISDRSVYQAREAVSELVLYNS